MFWILKFIISSAISLLLIVCCSFGWVCPAQHFQGLDETMVVGLDLCVTVKTFGDWLGYGHMIDTNSMRAMHYSILPLTLLDFATNMVFLW